MPVRSLGWPCHGCEARKTVCKILGENILYFSKWEEGFVKSCTEQADSSLHFFPVSTAGNDGEKCGFGKWQTTVLHYCMCGSKQNMHCWYVGNLFFVPAIFSPIYLIWPYIFNDSSFLVSFRNDGFMHWTEIWAPEEQFHVRFPYWMPLWIWVPLILQVAQHCIILGSQSTTGLKHMINFQSLWLQWWNWLVGFTPRCLIFLSEVQH